MCMVDDGDPCDVYTELRPRARIAHRCDECQQTIPPGDIYVRVTMLYESFWCTAKMCMACRTGPAAWLEDECGGFVHGGVWDDLYEHWGEFWGEGRLELGRQIINMRDRMHGRRRRYTLV